MKANYVKVGKVSPTFQVSTYQMAILLLFNDADVVTYDEMVESTSLAKETLDPCLGVFTKAKLVVPQPDNAKPQSGTSYKFNPSFKTKKIKVNFNIGIKSEQKQEVEDTHKTIEEDRKLLMQVCLIPFPCPFDDMYANICHSRPLCVS
jgi:cullin 1